MTDKIRTLLALVDQFPIIRRIEYHNNEHLHFVNSVLLALRDAEPDIRNAFDPCCIYCGKRGTDAVAVSLAANQFNHYHESCVVVVTIPTPSPADAPSPSSGAPASPAVASSSRNQEASPSTAGSDGGSGRTADTSDTSASGSATPTAAEVAPPLPPAPRPKPVPRARTGVAPRRVPPATPEGAIG